MFKLCFMPFRLSARAIVLTALVLAAAGMVTPAHAQTVRLTVNVSGLFNYRGKVVVYLWAESEETARFPDPVRVQRRDERGNDVPCDFPEYALCRRTIESLQDLKARFVFGGLPPGDYAVFVFHDENNDGVFNTGFLKRPLEGRGFSHVLPEELHFITSQVRFSQAKITVHEDTAITAGLKYPPRW
jgi:uncharacterized protein (DUF2141 family)